MAALELCLLDAYETERCEHRRTVRELALTGRGRDGRLVVVYVEDTEAEVYVAVGATWDSCDGLARDLNASLVKSNKGAKCTRTQCPCRYCEKCKTDRCKCQCWRCQKKVCTCVCAKCDGECVCEQAAPAAFNHDPCARDYRDEKAMVLGVELVYRMGAMGYEPAPRRFCRVRLTRAVYVKRAERFLLAYDTGARERGVFEGTPNILDGFMRVKNLAGCTWLRVAGARRPHADARPRVHDGADVWYAHWKDVSAAADQGLAAPLVEAVIDIETLAGKRFTEQDPICVVCVRSGGEAHAHIFDAGAGLVDWPDAAPWHVFRHRDEAALLRGLVASVQELDPDVLVGHNANKFDWPHVLRRCRALGVAPDFTRFRGEPMRYMDVLTSNRQAGTRNITLLDCPGRAFCDTMVYLKANANLRGYGLKDAAKAYKLGIGKDDLPYEQIPAAFNGSAAERGKLVKYCARDVEVTDALLGKCKMVPDLTARSRVCRVLFSQTSRGGMFLYARSLRTFMMGRFLVQDVRYGEEPALWSRVPALRALVDANDYVGGLVQDPVAGLHRWPVLTLDFTSLYPMIMIWMNLCITTYVGDLARMRELGLREEQCRCMPNGHWFVRAEVRKGVIPHVLETYLEARNAAKRAMKDPALDQAARDAYDKMQLNFKIRANSVYGAIGAKVNRAGNMAIAEAVTMIGRECITKTRDYVLAKYNAPGRPKDVQVIYGDTDSIMVKRLRLDCVPQGCGFDPDRDELTDAWRERMVAEMRVWGAEVERSINEDSGIFQKPMGIVAETVYLPYLLMKKKRYAGATYTMEGSLEPKIKSQGTETKKRDAVLYVANQLTELFDRMLIRCQPVPALLEFARQAAQCILLNQVPLEEMTMTNNITRKLSEYKGTLPKQVRVANQMNAAGLETGPGDRIKILLCEVDGSDAVGDMAFSYDLYDGRPLAFRQYLKCLQKPFDRALEHVATLEQRRQLWDPQTYTQLVPGAVLKSGPLLQFFAPVLADPGYRHVSASHALTTVRGDRSLHDFMHGLPAPLPKPPAAKRAKRAKSPPPSNTVDRYFRPGPRSSPA